MRKCDSNQQQHFTNQYHWVSDFAYVFGVDKEQIICHLTSDLGGSAAGYGPDVGPPPVHQVKASLHSQTQVPPCGDMVEPEWLTSACMATAQSARVQSACNKCMELW